MIHARSMQGKTREDSMFEGMESKKQAKLAVQHAEGIAVQKPVVAGGSCQLLNDRGAAQDSQAGSRIVDTVPADGTLPISDHFDFGTLPALPLNTRGVGSMPLNIAGNFICCSKSLPPRSFGCW